MLSFVLSGNGALFDKGNIKSSALCFEHCYLKPSVCCLKRGSEGASLNGWSSAL